MSKEEPDFHKYIVDFWRWSRKWQIENACNVEVNIHVKKIERLTEKEWQNLKENEDG